MIQNENSVLKQGTEIVLKVTANGFYKDLYTKQNTDKISQRQLLRSVNMSISPTDKAICDDPISLIQLELAMKDPGLDGL